MQGILGPPWNPPRVHAEPVEIAEQKDGGTGVFGDTTGLLEYPALQSPTSNVLLYDGISFPIGSATRDQ